MAASILINFGTLSKPNDCLSESSWKITQLLIFIFYFSTIVEKSPILTEPGHTFQTLLYFYYCVRHLQMSHI